MGNQKGLYALLLTIFTFGLVLAHYTSEREVLTYDIASRNTELGKVKGAKKATKVESSVLLNDPNMKETWGMQAIDTQRAWRITQGSKDVVVAIIDTGIDVNHPDIRPNLWRNPKELHNNHKGFIGDMHGWNFVDDNSDLTDNHGHGTHIAGIVGAVGGNNYGISGVAPKVSLMVLKYYDPKSTNNNNLKNTLKAFEYAIENGASIINYSGGGTAPSAAEKAVIKRARKLGILVVAAAGNESSDSDVHKFYPADYDLDNIISVTAVNKSKNVLSSSNYGKSTVDIAAPGHNIYSTFPMNKGQFGYLTGTSQATAYVTGVAALIKSHNPSWKGAQVIKHIMHTGDKEPSLIGKTRYQRKINTYRALAILDQGVGLTGVMAENTSTMKKNLFVADQDEVQASDSDSLVNAKSFGKNLLSHIKINKRKLANKKKANEPKL